MPGGRRSVSKKGKDGWDDVKFNRRKDSSPKHQRGRKPQPIDTHRCLIGGSTTTYFAGVRRRRRQARPVETKHSSMGSRKFLAMINESSGRTQRTNRAKDYTVERTQDEERQVYAVWNRKAEEQPGPQRSGRQSSRASSTRRPTARWTSARGWRTTGTVGLNPGGGNGCQTRKHDEYRKRTRVSHRYVQGEQGWQEQTGSEISETRKSSGKG